MTCIMMRIYYIKINPSWMPYRISHCYYKPITAIKPLFCYLSVQGMLDFGVHLTQWCHSSSFAFRWALKRRLAQTCGKWAWFHSHLNLAHIKAHAIWPHLNLTAWRARKQACSNSPDWHGWIYSKWRKSLPNMSALMVGFLIYYSTWNWL